MLLFTLPSPPSLAVAESSSVLVVDRNGALLRPFTTRDGRWRLPVRAEEVDPRFLTFLKAYEDRHFDAHPGVNPLALLRATGQAMLEGGIVSGGSTLSMQTVRLLEANRERTMARKLHEVGAALMLEHSVGKARVLDLYLTLAPYGGNLEGVRAASLAYFGKEPKRLSVAEAALLIALPQSPEARRPDRNPAAARRARDHVLTRLQDAGVLSAPEVEAARAEPVPDGRRAFPMLAAHAAEDAVAAHPGMGRITLSIDRAWQDALEQLAKDRARALGPRLSMAMVVVEHATGQVRAYVGAADYMDDSRAGHVDQAQALRSPGSALKPFVYGLAFEEGLAHPETLIEDRPTRFDNYAPKNFDQGYQGTVSVRQALEMSLNVPAVALLDAVGPQRLAARLRAAGADLVLPAGETPGLAIGLGGAGIRLTDLAMLYTGLARGGAAVPLSFEADQHPSVLDERHLLDTAAAWQTADVLAGTPPPLNASARIAFKTGTSYGYRDAWAAGFDGRYVIAVWAGRPDGAASPGLVARDTAAPVLFDAFARITTSPTPLPPAPADVLRVFANTELPPPLRRFLARGEVATPTTAQDIPLAVAFPPDGAEVDLDADPLALKAAGGSPPFTWLVDGQPVATRLPRREASWTPPGPGFARITVMDGRGVSASTAVRLR